VRDKKDLDAGYVLTCQSHPTTAIVNVVDDLPPRV
jgi:hypothetical protein